MSDEETPTPTPVPARLTRLWHQLSSVARERQRRSSQATVATAWDDTVRIMTTGNGCVMCEDQGCSVCMSQPPAPRQVASGTMAPRIAEIHQVRKRITGCTCRAGLAGGECTLDCKAPVWRR